MLLADGLEAFVARASLARKARYTIDAQYYLLHDDLTGRLFVHELLAAADRGVKVRLLLDDMDLDGRDRTLATITAHPNVEVRIFNPFGRNLSRNLQLATRFGSVTRRMHNKSFTIDGAATILGGRNIGNEYFEADPLLAFGDLDILAIGPIAQEVTKSFDQYWNHQLAYPSDALASETFTAKDLDEFESWLSGYIQENSQAPYFRELRASSIPNQLARGELPLQWGEVLLLADSPEKLISSRNRTDLHLSDDLSPYFRNLNSELIVFSPYFVPGDEGVAYFKSLQERGVRVRILTNSLASTDVPVVHAGYASHRRDLLEAGVELYEMNRQLTQENRASRGFLSGSSKASLHAKSFILDRKRIFIGSLNLDPRSFVENTEIGVIVDADDTAQDMANWLDEHALQVAFKLSLNSDDELIWTEVAADGTQTVYEVEPHSGFFTRFFVNILGWLPIDSQL